MQGRGEGKRGEARSFFPLICFFFSFTADHLFPMSVLLCFSTGINHFPHPGSAQTETSVSGSATSSVDRVTNLCGRKC